MYATTYLQASLTGLYIAFETHVIHRGQTSKTNTAMCLSYCTFWKLLSRINATFPQYKICDIFNFVFTPTQRIKNLENVTLTLIMKTK